MPAPVTCKFAAPEMTPEITAASAEELVLSTRVMTRFVPAAPPRLRLLLSVTTLSAIRLPRMSAVPLDSELAVLPHVPNEVDTVKAPP